MKSFEEQWKHTLLRDAFKPIAETYWRAAYESIKREIEKPTNVDGLAMFIDEELETGEQSCDS